MINEMSCITAYPKTDLVFR